MQRIILICLTLSLLAGNHSFAQNQPVIDTVLYPNLGPYEARGTVKPVKRHIPFYQHVWKAIEYPIEGTARILTAPLIVTSTLIPRDYRIGHLTQIFYFDNHKGYIFPSFTVQSDRGVDGTVALYHNSFPLQTIGVGAEIAYGGRTEHSFGFRIDERSLEQKGILFSLNILSVRRPDRYFYGIGTESSKSNKSAIMLRMFRIDAKWSIRVSSNISVKPTIRFRRIKDSYDEQYYSVRPAQDGYSFENYKHDADRYYDAGLKAVYDTRPSGDLSYSGSIVSGYILREFSEIKPSRVGDRFWLYGAVLKRYFEIPRGGKSLSLSLRFDGVRAEPNKRVPFWNLPTIGGRNLLRGFSPDRFRDNIALVTSVEYDYSIFQKLRGKLFVDFGSVAPVWELFYLKDFKTGYGFELKADLDDNFAFQFQIAHSLEGLQLYVGTSSRFSVLSGELNR